MSTIGLERTPAEPVLRDVSEAVGRATKRLASIPGIRRRFGVVCLWPGQKTAEHENIERLQRAAEMIGAEVLSLDRHGRIIDQQGRGVTRQDVDFVLHIHFETPKTYEPISIGALWNPFEYYFNWGFERHWSNQLSHDLFAWTGASQLQTLIAAERGPVAAASMTMLSHSLAEPILLPEERSSYRAFYCGINWEKVGRRQGRHEEFLKQIDRSGRLDVYGPDKLNGVKVWAGFDGYRGPIPFDGKSVVRKVWDAGAALVLSSDAHKASGVMSNRLFEAMAGGAVVLGDDHPFIRKAIGTNYVSIPMSLDSEKRAAFVVEALRDFESNPSRAAAMARNAQARLVDSFFLCDQIAGLFEAAASATRRQEAIVRTNRTASLVDVVVQALDRSGPEISKFLAHISLGFGEAANVVLLVSEERFEEFIRLGNATVVAVPHFDARRFLSIGTMFDLAREHLGATKTIFMLGIEHLYGATALSAIAGFGTEPVGRLSHVLRHWDQAGLEHRDYILGALPSDYAEEPALASYVFQRAWLKDNVTLPELSPRGLARLAARQGHNLPVCYPSAVEIDLRAYEALKKEGYRWHDWRGSEAATIDRVSSWSWGDRSDVAIESIAGRGPLTTGDNLAGEIGAALRLLPEAQRLDLARSLFESLPIPGWMKRLMRLVRRRLGH